jgi:hypothetical protein
MPRIPVHRDEPVTNGSEEERDMPRKLWGPDGRRWEIVYHQAYQTWEVVDAVACPFSLQYTTEFGMYAETCRICGGQAEPAVFLRNPSTGSVLFDTGPVCLDCVCGNRSWYTRVPISIPRSLLREPGAVFTPFSVGNEPARQPEPVRLGATCKRRRTAVE